MTGPIARRAVAGAGPDAAREWTEEAAIYACDCVLDLAAAFFAVPSCELRQSGRGTLDVTRVRQIAMYCANTVLGMRMIEVGKGFGRDRTTVVYACHLIEDLREDREFDAVVMRMERLLRAAFRMTEEA